MAWLWWLLAPVASTLLGGLILMLRAASESDGRPRRLRRDAMAEHQALLAALARHDSGESVPSPVRVLDREPADPTGQASHANPTSHVSQAVESSQASSHAGHTQRDHSGEPSAVTEAEATAKAAATTVTTSRQR